MNDRKRATEKLAVGLQSRRVETTIHFPVEAPNGDCFCGQDVEVVNSLISVWSWVSSSNVTISFQAPVFFKNNLYNFQPISYSQVVFETPLPQTHSIKISKWLHSCFPQYWQESVEPSQVPPPALHNPCALPQ